LIAKVRWADHCHSACKSAIENFASDDASFDRFASAHVVGDQQSDWVLAQRQHERDELIWARRDREASEAAKRRGPASQTQAGSVQQQKAAGRVARIGRIRRVEGAWLDIFAFERQIYADCIVVVTARQWAEAQHIGLVRRNPATTPNTDECANRGPGRVGELNHQRTASGMR
jgi:hypothetical protein